MTTEEKAKAYDDALQRARELNSGKNVDVEQGTTLCEYIFPELKQNIEKNIKDLINELRCSLRAAICQNDACGGTHENRIARLEWGIGWLEEQIKKQKDISSIERVFRPAGCSITYAATQAIKQEQLGYKIVLAFNGAYIPVEGKTVKDIVNEYYSWVEKGYFEKKNKD